jgi:hypothetical protein
MNTKQFLAALRQNIGTPEPDVYGKKWTDFIYPILYQIGVDAGFSVDCKKFTYKGKDKGNGERFGFDFMYTPSDNPEGPPAVVIEHENCWDYPGKEHDFSKLCLVVAPLRIFIGYCGENKSDAVKHADKLRMLYSSRGMRQITGGETTILLSWDVEPTPWMGWSVIGENSWSAIE